ncbi:hypothetical protein SY88_08895 [Clostridiales bacterium PH28_bin88]|nr:hypothetical protein SY88_08895 [Clostridiales bacterium PH28_bin88]
MKIGLALGGGSLRGAAHIGVLQVLLDNGIVPDIVAGTSAGSIITGFYAAGFSPGQMTDWLRETTKGWCNYEKAVAQNLFRSRRGLLPSLPLGLIQGKSLERMALSAIGRKTFSQLKLPAAVVTTDLYTGQGVVFTSRETMPQQPLRGMVFTHEGEVVESIRASIAIPGVFTPKKIGKRTLVDGGLVDNVPADVVKHLGADVVIAVDLGFQVQQTTPFKNMIQVLVQSADIMGQRITDQVLGQYADVVLHPETGGAGLLDFGKIPAMIQAGVAEATRRLPEIKSAIQLV